MPRPIGEYTFADWLHLRPPLHAIKTLRYRFVDALYRRQGARGGDLGALHHAVRGRRLLVTVAFDDPEILGRQLAAVRAHVPNVVHVVADNCRTDELSRAVRDLCGRTHTGYVRLPPNPWSRRVPSRSHGLALNWLWQHLVLPGGPAMFGFLDHDLVPVEPCDPFEPLDRQPVHGDKRWAGQRWFLWAGYCFFRPEILARAPRVDFGQDWFVGLDTGGGNWRSLYAALDPAALEERPIERLPVAPGLPVADCYIEKRGAWLHEVGFDSRPDLKAVKRERFLALLDSFSPPLPTTAPS